MQDSSVQYQQYAMQLVCSPWPHVFTACLCIGLKFRLAHCHFITGHALALLVAFGNRCVYRRQEWKVAMLTLIGRGKKSNSVGFSETTLQKKRPISQEFCRKIRDKFHRNTIVKRKPTSQKFSEQILLRSNRPFYSYPSV